VAVASGRARAQAADFEHDAGGGYVGQNEIDLLLRESVMTADPRAQEDSPILGEKLDREEEPGGGGGRARREQAADDDVSVDDGGAGRQRRRRVALVSATASRRAAGSSRLDRLRARATSSEASACVLIPYASRLS
jgi:hypothetical protein